MRKNQDPTGEAAGPSIRSRAGPNVSAFGGLSIAVKTASTLDRYPGQFLGP